MTLPIVIQNAVTHTWVIGALGASALFATAKTQTDTTLAQERTQELKGFAILAVLFAHIGYYLVADTRFLFPFSSIAGIALNAFLLLSGYGLVKSFSQRPTTPSVFYYERLFKKLWIPFWIALAFAIVWHALFAMLFPTHELLLSVVGVFPVADIYRNINSPLWYFTFITLNYLVFPLVFTPKRPIASSLILLALCGLLSLTPLPFLSSGVDTLYRVHLLAFPLGMLAASIPWPQNLIQHQIARWAYFLASATIFFYAASHAHIGEGVRLEAQAGLVGAVALLIAFLTKPFAFRALAWMGGYSYELYLLHWPLLLHDHWFFPRLPASVSLILWIVILLGVITALQRASKGLQRGAARIAEYRSDR